MRIEKECNRISLETNPFEMVLVAAREAHRLNATLKQIDKVGVTGRLNPVTLALERVRAGLIPDDLKGEASSVEVPMAEDHELEARAAQSESEQKLPPASDDEPEGKVTELPPEEEYSVQVEQIVP